MRSAQADEIDCTFAVRDAFRLSLRWLAVCYPPPGEDGREYRIGPFQSREEAHEYISQRCDGKYRTERMYDVAVFEKRMERWHQAIDERRKYDRAMASEERAK